MMPLLRVLLVDDSAADRFLAQEVFATHELTVDLTLCESGAAALEYMHRHHGQLPDVLLLDINMPTMTGFEVLATMKHDPELAHIPVVMLSTSQSSEDIRAAYTLQASSYLVKSPQFNVFLEQVEAFITYWSGNRFRYSAQPQVQL
jgi:CheY-like chemotaxis protein